MEPFDDPVLGRVEWNAEFDFWVARFVLPDGRSVEFEIDEGAIGPRIQATRATFRWVSEHEIALRDQLAERMLDLARTWKQSGEPEITAASFAERVRLTAAALDDADALTLYYADGDMFGGHLILVNVGADRLMNAPYLAG